nr:sigma-70 family RNA polymerase sigma factor [Lysinibacillus timonensis]
MKNFDEVLEQYEPMITSILKKAHVYKNHEHFRQSARIALWKAWQNYDPNRGPFAPYAYRSMLTSIYTEMRRDNRYADYQIPVEKDKLTFVAQGKNIMHMPFDHVSTLTMLKLLLQEKDYQLLLDIYYYHYSYDELARKYNTSVATLKKRRARILEKLRKAME